VTKNLKEAIECAQIDLHFAAAELRAVGAGDERAALLHMEQAANALISAARSWREGTGLLDANPPPAPKEREGG
jgi:hypothetical protein